VSAPDLDNFDAVLLDLDGTVYNEDRPLPGAIELIRKLQMENRNFACLSNSASSPLRVMDRLNTMGADLAPDQIYTAAAAACDYVLEHYPQSPVVTMPGHPLPPERPLPRVFNLCTQSVHEMLEGQVTWVQATNEPCDAVIVGAPSNAHATEDRQRMALSLLRHGAGLIGLCADRIYPSPRGLEFGAGAMCAMLSYAANIRTTFCGKPEPIFFNELCRRLNVPCDRCILIGDNLESDVLGAKTVGMSTILVLSGVTRRRDLFPLLPEQQPDFVIEDLRELLA
jgi:HAD superfamily hydrolase (TIGR01450 family)